VCVCVCVCVLCVHVCVCVCVCVYVCARGEPGPTGEQSGKHSTTASFPFSYFPLIE